MFTVEFFYIHFFSCFPEPRVKISDFFNDGYCHVVDLVASLIEVMACCLVEMLIGNISLVF